MENVRLRIGYVPTRREGGLKVKVLVAFDEGIEDEIADALGLSVDADTRIKVVGTALDDHDQRVGVRLARTGAQRKQERGGEQEMGNFSQNNSLPHLYHRDTQGAEKTK